MSSEFGTILDSFAAPNTSILRSDYDGLNLLVIDVGTEAVYILDPSDGTVLDSFVCSLGGGINLSIIVALPTGHLVLGNSVSPITYLADREGNIVSTVNSSISVRNWNFDGLNLIGAQNSFYVMDDEGNQLDSASWGGAQEDLDFDGLSMHVVGAAGIIRRWNRDADIASYSFGETFVDTGLTDLAGISDNGLNLIVIDNSVSNTFYVIAK